MKYFLQLLGFAVVSEVPWYLLNGADGTHNVLFTLTLGVMALAAIKALKKDGILCGAVILSIAGFAHLVRSGLRVAGDSDDGGILPVWERQQSFFSLG